MKIERKDPGLNEIIELFDTYYERADHDAARAYASLGKVELQFIENEIERCMDFRYYSENYHCIQTEHEGIHTLFPWWDSQEIFYRVVVELQVAGKKVKIIVLKARQLGLCLDPSTKILTADLQWIPIEDIQPGQEVVATDEGQTIKECREMAAQRQRDWRYKRRGEAVQRQMVRERLSDRKMRTATVLARRDVFEPAFRITMDDGRELTATALHKFLCKRRGGVEPQWRTIEDVRLGDEIRYITKPWSALSSFEDGWMGGLIDGEGSCRQKAKNYGGCEVNVSQVPGPVYNRAYRYLEDRGYSFREEPDKNPERKSKFGNKPVGKLVLSRMDEMFRLIGQTRPIRFIGKRWWEGKSLPGKNSGIGWNKVRSIEALPSQRMIDLQTDTKTFIAEGFVSHNSTFSSALTFHKTIFTEACNSVVVAQDADQADYLFEMSRRAYELLPWWMKPEAKYESKGRYLVFDRKDEQKQFSDPGLKSQILVAASNKAHGVGVGKTFRSAHLTELSLWRDADVLSKHLFPTMNAPDTLAIMESTARGRNNTWHSLWKNAEEGKIDWTPVFIEYIRVKKYSIPIPAGMNFELTKEEEGIKEHFWKEKHFEVTNESLYWRRKKIDEFIATEEEEWGFFGEYPLFPEEAFQGSGICAFDKRRLHKLLNTTCSPPVSYGEIFLFSGGSMIPSVRLTEVMRKNAEGTYVQILDHVPPQEKYGTRLYVWEEPIPGEVYYIAADVGYGAEGGDFSCAQVLRLGKAQEPDTQVAEWRGWIYPHPYAEVLFALGTWYNKAEIAIECNGPGLDTNNNLYQTLMYDKIFRWKHYDKIKNRLTDYFGWWTNVKTRDTIITRMAEAIDDGSIILRSTRLVDEMFDFSSEEPGARYEGQTQNDDRVLGIMICFFCAHDSDEAQYAASINRQEEQVKKKQDFQNSDYSPVHDVRGSMRNRLFKDKGIPAEVLQVGDGYAEHDPTAEEDQWKLW